MASMAKRLSYAYGWLALVPVAAGIGVGVVASWFDPPTLSGKMRFLCLEAAVLVVGWSVFMGRLIILWRAGRPTPPDGPAADYDDPAD